MESIETNKAKQDKETRWVAEKEYWTAAKAARYLGVSKVSVLTYAKQKRISNLKFCGSVLFRPEDLDAFLDESRTIGVATRKK